MSICRWDIKSDMYIYETGDGTVDLCGEENCYEIYSSEALRWLGENIDVRVFGDIVVTRLANLDAHGTYFPDEMD